MPTRSQEKAESSQRWTPANLELERGKEERPAPSELSEGRGREGCGEALDEGKGFYFYGQLKRVTPALERIAGYS